MDSLCLMLTCCCLLLAFTQQTTQISLTNFQNISSTTVLSLNVSENLNISTTLSTETALTTAEDISRSSTAAASTTMSTTSATSTTVSTTTPGLSPTSESTTAESTLSSGVTAAPQTQTSASHSSESHSTTVPTTNSSAVNSTQSDHSAQGGLSPSERTLTITFSVMLGIFALAVVVVKLHRCSHKLQFLHQPLNNTDAQNVAAADSDSLGGSVGPYEGHPIYDCVPPARQDESQFRLEFLH